MLKRILVALDPDPDTTVATRYGISLAEKHNASITGLAVVDSNQITAEVGNGGVGTVYYIDQLQQQMSESTRREAGKLLDSFREMVERAGIRFGETLEEGVPYERIIEDMKYHDLLIIGRDPHFYYNRPELKTNTLAQVIKKGNVPSLVVTESYREVNSALVAYDGSSSAVRTLQWFAQLAPFGKQLELELVHVDTGGTRRSHDEANLLLRLSEDFLKVHEFSSISKTILDGDEPAEQLMSRQKEIGADLFILGAHSMSALRRLAFGSVTHYLVTRSTVPMFMCH
ncbi:MAG: universal stress protein [Balneolaceae bacterium]|nr:universal stress protein [Balneolaceae bacterium]